ncbi:hypothetical protein C8Q80DRAFT_1340021 [Daedaleopsis nitida]|nr:hypothetical protein C8Q80DRAFT_1340021 [Daedaleopsis nitida]
MGPMLPMLPYLTHRYYNGYPTTSIVTAERLRLILTETPSYCSGTLPLQPRDAVLYYSEEEGTARRIDLAHPSADALDVLERACDPAPFGRNEETILDPTYRRAGKMEVDAFMLGFDAERLGLVDVIRSALFAGAEESKHIYAELYKLNVYGENAFFKSHVDTPRASNMFGSLVVLILRHDGREWTFDSATVLSETSAAPTVAFVAFFSDVEHEVAPVRTGHRVTITYNLYFDSAESTRRVLAAPPPSGLRILHPIGANSGAVSSALAALLSDATVLPQGGTIGFGLRHQYPMPSSWTGGDPNPLHTLRSWLKGADAALFAACEAHGLVPKLRLRKERNTAKILLDRPVEVHDYDTEEDDPDEVICRDLGGVLMLAHPLVSGTVVEGEPLLPEYWSESTIDESVDVHMVTEITHYNRFKSTMVVNTGNDAGVGYMYKSVCLTVDVGAPQSRGVVEGRPRR